MPVRPAPMGPRVLVKVLEPPESTSAGIVLPDAVVRAASSERGMVIEVGSFWRGFDAFEGIEEKKLPLDKGDVVVWEKGKGTAVTLDNSENGVTEEFVVLDIEEVLLRLEDVPAMLRTNP